ncbi:hypothetical protein [Sphingomonas arenae]|nr:hypothetical protein [Sphingomonas arenae]
MARPQHLRGKAEVAGKFHAFSTLLPRSGNDRLPRRAAAIA